MPIVRVEMVAGRSPEQKTALIHRLTEAVVDTLGAKPEQVRVLITEVPPENWAVGGVTKAESRLNGQSS